MIEARYYYLPPRSLDAPWGFREDSRRDLKNLVPIATKLLEVENSINKTYGIISRATLPFESSFLCFYLGTEYDDIFLGNTKYLFTIAGYPERISSSKKGFKLIQPLLGEERRLKRTLRWPLNTDRVVVDNL